MKAKIRTFWNCNLLEYTQMKYLSWGIVSIKSKESIEINIIMFYPLGSENILIDF